MRAPRVDPAFLDEPTCSPGDRLPVDIERRAPRPERLQRKDVRTPARKKPRAREGRLPTGVAVDVARDAAVGSREPSSVARQTLANEPNRACPGHEEDDGQDILFHAA